MDGGVSPSPVSSYYTGGGSGGSVWITAGVLRGSAGSLSAKGGDWAQYSSYGRGGGGGGRVALYCTTNEFEGGLPAFDASGGSGYTNAYIGGCGTIYVDCGSSTQTLLLDTRGKERTDAYTLYLTDTWAAPLPISTLQLQAAQISISVVSANERPTWQLGSVQLLYCGGIFCTSSCSSLSPTAP